MKSDGAARIWKTKMQWETEVFARHSPRLFE